MSTSVRRHSLYVDAEESADGAQPGDDAADWVDDDDGVEDGTGDAQGPAAVEKLTLATDDKAEHLTANQGVQTDSMESSSQPPNPMNTVKQHGTQVESPRYLERPTATSATAHRSSFSSSILTIRSQSSRRAIHSRLLRRSRGVNEKRRLKNKTSCEALIELKEENAADFHDLLCWIYPNLDCLITWNNVEGVSTGASVLGFRDPG
jgi:hypothetical protein